MPVKPTIGMSVPGASSLMDQPSLADQVAGETEEQRRKRLQAMNAAKSLPAGISSLAPDYGAAMSMS
jgi:hypothetical protein